MKSSLIAVRVCLLALTTVAFVRATEAVPGIDERLARIERQLAKLEARVDGSVSSDQLAPTVQEVKALEQQLGNNGKNTVAVVKATGSETKLAIGGFFQAMFESGQAPDARYAGINDRFYLRRARLNVSGAFAQNFSFKLESDFGSNALAPKTGVASQATDAYLTWTEFSTASVRVGQFKTPFGFEQLMSDTKIYTEERSIANDRLTLGRQVGAMVFGDVDDHRFGYSLGAFNGTGTNISSNDNQKFLWVGRATAVAYEGKAGSQKVRLSTGVDYFTTVDKGSFTGHRYGWSTDAQLAVGPAELQAEWLRNDLHPIVGASTASEGWALLGAYTFTPHWQGVVRYESYDSNTAATNTTTDLWTFGVNYLIKGDELKLSLDYLSGSQPTPVPHGDRILGRLQVMF